jgi:hypothetical protein
MAESNPLRGVIQLRGSSWERQRFGNALLPVRAAHGGCCTALYKTRMRNNGAAVLVRHNSQLW